MIKAFLVLGLALMIFVSLFMFKSPTRSQETISQEYVPNEVLVKFKPKAGKQLAIAALDVLKPRVINYLGKEIDFSDWDPEIRAKSLFLGDPYLVHLRVPESIGTEKAISILKNNPNVEYAEPNYIYKIMEMIPNDPYFPKLWSLKNTGQTGGKPGADIKATLAWDIFTGSPEVVVAVIDTGIDYNHEDLAQNIWINTNEIPNNNIDDDGNGYVDDYRGWNFVNNNKNPMDDNSHGTHVSGIIVAKGNNFLGIVGVCWNIKLMPLKAGDRDGYFKDSNIVKAIDYAWRSGAKISNNSYGGYVYSQAIFDAISRAHGSGHLFIAAAGNERNDNDKNPAYPASYRIPNIISVLATDDNDTLAGYSNYGATNVHVGAPGGADDPNMEKWIFSTILANYYGFKSSTSMAAPYVTGVVALFWGKCLPYVNHNQVKRRILEKVDVLPSLNGKMRF
ncbi:MAG: S8 family peptidase [Methanothermobacter tenebrarum]